MKVFGVLTFFLFASALVGCNNNGDEDEYESTSSNSTTITAPLPDSANRTGAITVPDVVKNPAAAVTTAQLNPPHGQPGHRCDIAVGKPLNSKPAASTAVTSPLPAATAPKLPVLTAPLATPALNPKHGQPGHRCDILVGQPLNSAPATSAQSAPVASPFPTPPSGTSASAAATTAPGMNPRHGQPGHRCDIAVGKPLNSKPLTP